MMRQVFASRGEGVGGVSNLSTEQAAGNGSAIPWLASLAIAIALAYANGLSGPFLFDDKVTVLANPSIRHLSNWSEIFRPASVFMRGRPLLNLSYAINYALGGASVRGYHVVNVLVHILVALTFWGVVRQTLEKLRLADRFGVSTRCAATAVALIWALNPVQTASVTYVSQRAESMMALAYLLTLTCLIRGAGSPRGAAWSVGAVAACAAGMALKEVMATAPVVCLIYDRLFLAGTFRGALQRRPGLYAGLAATWLILAGLVLNSGFRERIIGAAAGQTGMETYSITQVRAVAHYFCLGLWPHPLVFDYGMDQRVFEEFSLVASAGLLLVLLAAGGFAWFRYPPGGFLAAWFFIVLAPSSSFVPVLGQPIAQNRAYLPTMAVAAGLVAGVLMLCKNRSIAPLWAIAACFGLLTWERNRDYRSQLGLWSDTVAKCPGNHRAQGWLGLALLDAPGRHAEAMRHLEAGRRLGAWDVDSYYNLGLGYLRDPARISEAISCFQIVLRYRPNDPSAQGALGAALAAANTRLPEAAAHLERAVQAMPERSDLHKILGAVLLNFPDRRGEAVAQLQTAVRLNPRDPEARLDLGNAFLAQADGIDRAIAEYRVATQLRPDAFAVWFNLGCGLMRAGRDVAAEACFQKVLRLAPGFEPAKAKLAELHETRGKGK